MWAGAQEALADDSFEVTCSHIADGACVLTPTGTLDASTVPRFKDALVGALARGCKQLIVDVAQVDEVDPSALALLALAKKVRLRKGDLVVVCPDERVASRFTRSGIAVFGELQEAVDHLARDVRRRQRAGSRKGEGSRGWGSSRSS